MEVEQMQQLRTNGASYRTIAKQKDFRSIAPLVEDILYGY